MLKPSPMSRFESSPIVKSFRKNLETISDGVPLAFVCGVSGGADSMALLYLMHRHNLNCTVVHCNYQLRGAESGKDRDLVEQISALWNFECITATFNPDEAKLQNTQAWAREKRYQVFRDIKEEYNADFIVTAHHQTDQVETILQKILRGAGMSSWKGMDVVDGALFRPLIHVSKGEIQKFAEAHEVPYRQDASNEAAGYARNFIRQGMAPEMDHFFPGWRDNLLKIPQRAEEFSLMADVLVSGLTAGSNKIDRNALLKLPPTLWPVVFHHFLKKALPDVTFTEGAINRFLTAGELQPGASIELNESWKIIRDRNHFVLEKIGENNKGESLTVTRGSLTDGLNYEGIRLQLTIWNGTHNSGSLQIDADKLTWPFTLRRWQNGDRIQCLGMKGRKKVAGLLTDKKIRPSQKKDAILIESFDGIVSAVIFPHATPDGEAGAISEQVKCSPATKHILQIDKSP